MNTLTLQHQLVSARGPVSVKILAITTDSVMISVNNGHVTARYSIHRNLATPEGFYTNEPEPPTPQVVDMPFDDSPRMVDPLSEPASTGHDDGDVTDDRGE